MEKKEHMVHNGDVGKAEHEGHEGGHHDHHAMMVADFKRRFWISLALSLP